jgi:5'-3' exonuclease
MKKQNGYDDSKVYFTSAPRDFVTVLVDGRCLCWNATFRAYKFYPNATGREREATIVNALFDKLEQVSRVFNTTRIIFAWDCSKETSLRRKLYPDYKNNRAGWNPDKPLPNINLPDYKREQMEKNLLVRVECEAFWKTLECEIIPNLGFPCYKFDGYEGDDIIASIIKSNPHRKFIIYSDDNDYIQLVNDDVALAWVRDSSRVGNIPLYTKYRLQQGEALKGLPPCKWADVKALAGCRSDAVPGIRGIGSDTAVEYLLNDGHLYTKTGKTSLKQIKIEKAIESGEVALWDKLVRLPFEGTPEIKMPIFDKSKNEEYRDYFLCLCDIYGIIQKQDSEFWAEFYAEVNHE